MTLIARVVPSCVLLACAVGCATAGSTWVSQPEPGFLPSDDVTLQASAHPVELFPEPLAATTTGELDESQASRPRLSRTVTLGETLTAVTERAPEQRAPDRSSVHVTVNNYVTPQNSYDGYYAVPIVRDVRHGGGGARPSHPIARPSRPGQSWPAPPSYGPAFPFKTAPASPWAPDR